MVWSGSGASSWRVSRLRGSFGEVRGCWGYSLGLLEGYVFARHFSYRILQRPPPQTAVKWFAKRSLLFFGTTARRRGLASVFSLFASEAKDLVYVLPYICLFQLSQPFIACFLVFAQTPVQTQSHGGRNLHFHRLWGGAFSASGDFALPLLGKKLLLTPFDTARLKI